MEKLAIPTIQKDWINLVKLVSEENKIYETSIIYIVFLFITYII
jgi:hypothetical protein